MTVLVVGAGIAGVACARVLADAGVRVEIRDRARVPGGRLASRTLAGRPVDTGASYLTARDERFRDVVADWLARGVLRAWTDTFHTAGPGGLTGTKEGPMRYAGVRGQRALVTDLARDLDVRLDAPVRHVGPGPVADGTAYDAVVLAMPDPQAERLLDPDLTEERAAVARRPWQPALALCAGWPQRDWPAEFDGAFVADSPVLAWLADDGRRRGDGAPVLVAHSTADFAEPRLADPPAAVPALVEAVRRLLPGLDAPDWAVVHRWSYSAPQDSRDAAYHLGPSRVGLCGDGWGSSRVETAWLSGTALGGALAGLPVSACPGAEWRVTPR